MNISSNPLTYRHGETVMKGEFVFDSARSGPRPGVLVVHEAFGLGDHAIASARRLAEAGYAALAVDLWGNRTQLTEMENVMQTIGGLVADPAAWMGRLDAALAALNGQQGVDPSRSAAIGYCFGGASVLEFARRGAALKGVVSLHGALGPVGDAWSADTVAARILMCVGADDPLIPRDAITGFQQAADGSGVDYEIDIYGGTLHSFTNPAADGPGMPDFAAYNARADRRSWTRTVDFLAEIFA